MGSSLVGTEMTEKSNVLLVSEEEELLSVVLVLRRLRLAKPLDSCEGSIIVLLFCYLYCEFIEGGMLSMSVKSSWDARPALVLSIELSLVWPCALSRVFGRAETFHPNSFVSPVTQRTI